MPRSRRGIAHSGRLAQAGAHEVGGGLSRRSAVVHERIRQILRTTKIVLGDPTIPRPLRWGGAFGLLPIPGPVDEIVLLLIAAILAVFYRRQFRQAWREAASNIWASPSSSP